MLGNKFFYNRTIRKVVVAFGTLFNDIEIVRLTKSGDERERMRVPLSYGAKEKYITRLASDPDLTKSIATLIPRMSFNLDSISYDTSRKSVSTLQNFSYSTTEGFKKQYAPVPYNFDFSFSIYVRNTEDGTQILEQILPFFTPDFTVTIDFISGMEQKFDMPIILNSVTSSVDYEGDMTTTRYIVWDLQFTAKGYIWPAVRDDGQQLIGQYSSVGGPFANGGYGSVITNIYSNPSMNANTQLVKITIQADPIDAEPDDEFGFSETKIIYENNKL